MFSVHQHWDPLKVCAVGRSYPPEFYSHIKNPKVRNVMERIAIETEEDYQKLISKLKEFGVTVVRTDCTNIKEDYNIGSEKYYPPPMTPRDHTAMIGNKFFMPSKDPKIEYNFEEIKKTVQVILEDNKEVPKEYEQYFNDILLPGRGISGLEISLDGKTNQAALQAVFANDENIKQLFHMAQTNTIGSTKKYINNKLVYAFRSIEKLLKENDVEIVYDRYINSATTIRLGKDLYFNFVNLLSRLDAKRHIDNLITLFPGYRINLLTMPGHSDGALCPVNPGLLIGIYDKDITQKSFPGWEYVYLENESWKKVQPFIDLKDKNKGKWWIKGEEYNNDLVDYIETWMNDWVTYVEESVFDVNMLVIDEKNVICNGYNKQVFDAFERYGITPHAINFRHRYFWDGGLHCITSDLSREGGRKDYFPERGDMNAVIHQ